MSFLFLEEINNWDSWGKVFQNKEAFTLIIKEVLPNLEIENCAPGTNAVFKVGNYIIKIFAPKESGLDTEGDYKNELYGMKRAQELGISVPKVIKSGIIHDKYLFRYLVMDYIEGETLGTVLPSLTDSEKISIGKKLRQLTDKLNTSLPAFSSTDVMNSAFTNRRWNMFSESFNLERIQFLQQYPCQDLVYVHGDINPDNVLLTRHGELYLIDFADSLLAPIAYEHACIAMELFKLNRASLTGFFGTYEVEEIMDICMRGLLIHDFGANIIIDFYGDTNQIQSISQLKNCIYHQLK